MSKCRRIKKLIKPDDCMEIDEYLINNEQTINKKMPISYSDTFNSIKSSSYLTKIQSTNSVPNCHQFNTNE
ncbi:Sodium-dependent dopamine transporter [Schistosoma japonicum]|nr:Sodium-dependent dopamine transporter [Schistosoma japonicum]